ncbi:MAG: hypothetical protein CMH57_07635 [Myxococcales bacterium]|nr:hypothetical protein [Myxococcales bacterium]
MKSHPGHATRHQPEERRSSSASRASRLHLTLLLVVAVGVATFTGCRRHGAFEDKPRSVVPRNASQAARAWTGERLAFTDDAGKLLLKLRKRQSSTRVFDAEQRTLGYVRRAGNTLVLTRQDPKAPGYLIQPAEGGSDTSQVYLVHPTQPGEKGSVLTPKVDTETTVARISRDAPLKGCATWRFEGSDGEPFATLIQFNGSGEKERDCDAIDATWQATLGKDGDSSWWLSASRQPVRTLKATSRLPASDAKEADDKPTTIGLKLVDEDFPTFAAAPALFPVDDLLLKAGYVILLTRPMTK